MSGMDSTRIEEWRPVVGYEGCYETSSLGRIRALPRRVRIGHSATRPVPAKVLTLTPHPCGYFAVGLHRDNRAATFLVHRLVAEAFLGRIPPRAEVNHKDGDKRNNAVWNLEIVTRQENIDHAVRRGLIDNKGEKNAQAKLTAEQVQEIRAAHAAGSGYKAVAKRFGISWGTVRGIVKRYTWGHLAPRVHGPG